MVNKLKGKKILITAGPTWVAIDKVRVISNISTGETGCLIAKQAIKEGAKVTLLLGPTPFQVSGKSLKVIRFNFFEGLRSLLNRILKSKKFDVVIHTAAVSDYQLRNKFKGKLKSGIKNFKINLIPTEKIINLLKKIQPNIFLVGFKLNAVSHKEELIKASEALFSRAKADLVVANALGGDNYVAIILDRKKNILSKAVSRKELAFKLIKLLKQRL